MYLLKFCGLIFISKKLSLTCNVVARAFFQPHISGCIFEPVPVAVDVEPVNLSLLLLEKNSKSKEGNGLSASEKNDTISGF